MNKMEAGKVKDKVEIFYLNEIWPYLEKRRALRPVKDVGVLESPVVKIGVEKIQAKTPLGRLLVDFSHNSTIHGLNHLAVPRRHICERCFLSGTIIISLILLILLSLQPWERYQYNAAGIALDTDYKNFNITKPSFTICSVNPVNKTKFESVFKSYGIDNTMEARAFFEFISKVDYSQLNATPHYDKVQPEKWLRILNDLHADLIVDNNEYTNASTLVSTEYGICKSFGNHVSIYSSLEYWFANNFTIVPEVNTLDRNYYSFHNMKSHIVTTVKNTPSQIEVHYPDEIFLKPRYYLKTVNTYNLYIHVDEFYSSSRIRLLIPQQRHCKFLNDGGLKMWPVYTLNMCILECKYNKMYKACGCYPHFARPMKGIPVCNSSQLRCIGTANPTVYLIKNEYEECGCLVNCNSAFYMTNLQPFGLTLAMGDDSVVHMMLNIPVRKFIRNQIFGWTDFLISVGGACNLLLGASIISLIEVIYYASLRLCFYYGYLKLQKNRKITVANHLFKKE